MVVDYAVNFVVYNAHRHGATGTHPYVIGAVVYARQQEATAGTCPHVVWTNTTAPLTIWWTESLGRVTRGSNLEVGLGPISIPWLPDSQR
jgi:hypothetical protein